MAVPRDIYGRRIRVGDIIHRVGFESHVLNDHEVTNVREDGLVQVRGDNYHWYSTEQDRIVSDRGLD